MTEPRPTRIDDLVEKIRTEMTREDRAGSPLPSRSGLRDSDELRALNGLWATEPDAPIRSHRRWIGPIVVAMKRVFRSLVVTVLEGYLRDDREFRRNVVSILNRLPEELESLEERLAKIESEGSGRADAAPDPADRGS